jgi:hypothetical protein
LSDLSPRAQSIVDAARADDSPTGQSKPRIKRRVLARVAAAALAGTAAATASRTAASVATGSGAGGAATIAGGAATSAGAKIIVGVAMSALVASATATGVVVSRELASPAPAVEVARTARVAPAPPRKTLAIRQSPAEAPMPVAPPSAAPVLVRGNTLPAAAPKEPLRESKTETLEQELPLLQGAQRALRTGDLEQALTMLDSHAKRFPDGVLAEERRAVHAMALCRTNSGAARAEADEFLREAASSPLAERVREECTRRGTDGTVRGAGSRH